MNQDLLQLVRRQSGARQLAGGRRAVADQGSRTRPGADRRRSSAASFSGRGQLKRRTVGLVEFLALTGQRREEAAQLDGMNSTSRRRVGRYPGGGLKTASRTSFISRRRRLRCLRGSGETVPLSFEAHPGNHFDNLAASSASSISICGVSTGVSTIFGAPAFRPGSARHPAPHRRQNPQPPKPERFRRGRHISAAPISGGAPGCAGTVGRARRGHRAVSRKPRHLRKVA